MQERKLQATADIVISFMMINVDGTPATGLTLANLFSAIIKPDGTALAGYTEATFTEPGSDGTYIAIFSSGAATKAFTLEDEANPYAVTFNSSDVDIPVARDIRIVSAFTTDVNDSLDDAKGSGFDTNTDSLEAISDAIGAISLTGANQVTITVDDGTNPLENVNVSVWNATQTTFLGSAITDSLGQVTFGRDDGTYKIILSKAGVNFTVPETLVVSGNTSATYSGTVIPLPAPAGPDSVIIYEDLTLADDATFPSATGLIATATIIELPYDFGSKIHSGAIVNGTYDENTGRVTWDLVKGAKCRFMIKNPQPEEGWGIDNLEVTIPQVSTRLSDI
jgi:hypothetical protein